MYNKTEQAEAISWKFNCLPTKYWGSLERGYEMQIFQDYCV